MRRYIQFFEYIKSIIFNQGLYKFTFSKLYPGQLPMRPSHISTFGIFYLSFFNEAISKPSRANTSPISSLDEINLNSNPEDEVLKENIKRTKNLNKCENLIIPDVGCYEQEKDSNFVLEKIDCEAEFILQKESAKSNVMFRIMNIYRNDMGFVDRNEINDQDSAVSSENTSLNWEYLNLSPFKYQQFPMDQILGVFLSKEEPVLTPRGLNILRHYIDLIHFYNPKTIEGRRMLFFQKLYKSYFSAKGRSANPSFIDWSHVSATNWPVNISRTDINSWSDDDLKLLNFLLNDEDHFFKSSRSKSNQNIDPEYLGADVIELAIPAVKIDFRNIQGEYCALSDCEEVCGKNLKKKNKKKNISKPKNNSDSDFEFEKNENEIEFEIEFEESPGVSSTSSENINTNTSMSPSENITNQLVPNKKMNKRRPHYERIENVLIRSIEPANPKVREALFQKVLKIFRQDTHQRDAQIIDWTLLQVKFLEYHHIPFDLNLTTEGDVLTLEKLLSIKRIKFLNLNSNSGRCVRIYERLYRIYVAAADIYAAPYYIRWNDIIKIGWPEDISHRCSSLTNDEIARIKALLDAGEIKFTITDKFKEEISALSQNSKISNYAESVTSESSGFQNLSPDSIDLSENVSNESLDDQLLDSGASAKISVSHSTASKKRKLQTLKLNNFAAINNEFSDEELYFTDNSMLKVSKKIKKVEDNCSNTSSNIENIQTTESDFSFVDAIVNTSTASFSSTSSSTALVVESGVFAGITTEQLNLIIINLNVAVESYTVIRNNYKVNSRHYSIISDIIRGLNVILQYAMDQTTKVVMSVSDIQKHLTGLSLYLEMLESNGELDIEILHDLIRSRIRFRALLAGIKYRKNSDQLIISKSDINVENYKFFSSLIKEDLQWCVEEIEPMIDTHEIFIQK